MEILDIDVLINKIFLTYTKIDFSKEKHLTNEHLLGERVGLPARGLVCLLFDLERTLSISVPQTAILEGRFDNYNNIRNIIMQCIKKE